MLNIGITGHRNIDIKYIDKYKKEIYNKLYSLKQDNKILLYSSLADGADRLIVYEAIKLNIEFIVVLPMSKEKYKKDFDDISKIGFESLLAKSKQTIIVPTKKDNFKRDFQYELAGQYISNHCDILFALWDGEYNNLQGGTSEIVKYHLKQNKQLHHIKVDRKSI